jgi:Zn-finger nucleic acid-binding protein
MRCDKCIGVWIEWPVLAKLMRDIDPAHKWELQGGHEEHQRQCPKCQSQMLRSHIFQVPVDYCKTDKHGVWLDKDELKTILERVADSDVELSAPATSFNSLLNEFFSK